MYQQILVPRAGTFSTMTRGSRNRKCRVQISSLSLAVICGIISRSLAPVRCANKREGDASAPIPDAMNERRDSMAASDRESWMVLRMTSIDDSHLGGLLQDILPTQANCQIVRDCPIVVGDGTGLLGPARNLTPGP